MDARHHGISPTRFMKSACFMRPGKSNHRRYQYDAGIVKLIPMCRGDPLNVVRKVSNSLTKLAVSSSWPPRSGAPGYSLFRPNQSLIRDSKGIRRGMGPSHGKCEKRTNRYQLRQRRSSPRSVADCQRKSDAFQHLERYHPAMAESLCRYLRTSIPQC